MRVSLVQQHLLRKQVHTEREAEWGTWRYVERQRGMTSGTGDKILQESKRRGQVGYNT